MQPKARDGYTDTEIETLIHTDNLNVEPGLELVTDSEVVDISDRLSGGSVAHNNFATIHGTCRLRILEGLAWGSARVRLFVDLTAGAVTARFYLGVYLLDTPERTLGLSPEEYDVEGYDLLKILDQPAATSYAVGSGDSVVSEVRAILDAHGGGVGHLIEESSATFPAAKVWPLDPQTKWLGIVNDMLASIGFRGLYMDWEGRYRSETYQTPADRDPEWTYDADETRTIVGQDRKITADFFDAPNHWVFIRNNPAVGLADPATSGVYEVTNDADGPTSVDGRGRTISSVRYLDAVNQASLEAQGDQIVDREKRLDTTLDVTVGPNPLHWHADVVAYRDAAMGPPVKASVHEWSWEFDQDMTVKLRVVA